MRHYRFVLLLFLGPGLVLSSCKRDEDEMDYITFEELSLDDSGYWNGEDKSGTGFTSGNAWFPTYWDDTWGDYWEGFAYTNHDDPATGGIGNQFSSYPGGGAGGSSRYAVFYHGFYGTDTLSFLRPELLDRISVSNTAYAALAMRDGDQYTKKFGGEEGLDPDWFSLLIQGISPEGELSGSIEVVLSDFRPEGMENDFISNAWTTVPMETLGTVQKLVFSFASSDTSYGFINVPTYVCIDNIVGALK